MRGDKPETRIQALEAEVAELKAFLPMLGRMGFYEVWSGHSIPDHVDTIEQTLLSAARAQLSLYEDILSPGSCRLAEVPGPVEPELVRPQDEQLPAAAQAIQDASEERFRRDRKEAVAAQGSRS